MSFFYSDNDEQILNLKDGTSQTGRLRDALMPEYIKIVEKTVSDYLLYASKLAGQVRYYNANNEPDGDWTPFFERDESVILAIIAHTDLSKYSQTYNDIIRRYKEGLTNPTRFHAFRDLFMEVVEIAVLMDRWLKIFHTYNYQSEFNSELRNAISHLDDRFTHLKLYAEQASTAEGLKEAIRPEWDKVSDKWLVPEATTPFIFEGSNYAEKLNNAFPYVDEIFTTFLKSLTYLVQYAEVVLQHTMEKHQDHQPHIALYIAFLKLLEYSDAHINGLTKRHLDYYFYEVLKQERRKATPDHVHVFFDLSPTLQRRLVEAGTRMLAGKDLNDEDIIFETEGPVSVSRARIADLRTTYISQYPMVYVPEGEETVQGHNLFAAPIANSRDGIGEPFDEGETAWPLLGEDQFELAVEERTMDDMMLGLVIACPIMELTEGVRTLSISMEFERASYKEFNDYIIEFSQVSEITWKNAFHRLFSDAFECYFTAETGWKEYNKVDVTTRVNPDKNEYALVFTLDFKAGEEAIVPYNKEIYTDNLDINWPAVKLSLNNYASYNAYVVLRKLIIQKVSVDTVVKGYRNLSVINNIGPVNPDNPWQTFGPAPMLGSYFSFGDPRIINRYLQDLDVHLEWLDLPTDPQGFRGFYKNYGIDIDNDSFEVDISSVTGNQYLPPPKDRQVFKLFQSRYKEANAQPLSDVTNFRDIDLTRLPLENNFKRKTEDFPNHLQDGYIRVALINPYTSFGHNLFPKVFSSVAMFNSANKKKPKELPDLPYTPTIKTLEINYKARVTEDMSGNATREEADQGLKLVHLYPFGNNKFYPKAKDFTKRVLPRYSAGGTLYIGIENLDAPETLSILFQLHDVTYQEIVTPPEVRWAYLSDNQWKEVDRKNILSDTTNNLVSTGIVTITIPADITRDNTVMPAGLSWLSAYVPGNAVIMRTVTDIKLNAVRAVRVHMERNDPYAQAVLIPRSVVAFQSNVPGITTIHQPYISFSGRKGEAESEFYTRVSENLNHKLRAVTVADYERMVLERFPELFIAKCIGKVNEEQELLPGHNIQIIVIPRAVRKAVVELQIPKIEYNKLTQIKQYIEQHASYFINSEVSNPIYERVKVLCSVKFTRNENKGQFSQRLNEELRHFLSPWLFDNQAELRLGGFINISEILTFIENRPYVKYVTRFSVIHIYKTYLQATEESIYHLEDTADAERNLEIIKASSPYAVLISATEHDISVIDEEIYIKPALTSLGGMRVKDDFIIGEVKAPQEATVARAKADKYEAADGGEMFNFIISQDIE